MTKRPNVLQWLRYTFTGRAEPGLSEWVLHDVTCRTWLVRHCARFLVQLSPILLAVLVFLPASLPIRLGCVFAGVAASVLFSFGYVIEMAERRAERAGYPNGIADVMRTRRAEDDQRRTAARLRARSAARRARRG